MEIVRQLIDMGADRTCSDKNVRLPVHLCPVLSFSLSLSLRSRFVVNVFVAIYRVARCYITRCSVAMRPL